MDGDAQARARIIEHWRASEQGDSAAEHAIYAADAILDYPQSGERFRGRATIAAQRGGHPADRHFTVLRISGNGDLWVSECVISYDGVPSHSVSIMEFSGGLVAHETQYFAALLTRPGGGQRWPSRCRTVQADAGDRDTSVSAPDAGPTALANWQARSMPAASGCTSAPPQPTTHLGRPGKGAGRRCWAVDVVRRRGARVQR